MLPFLPVIAQATGGLVAGTAGRTAATGVLAAFAPALAPIAVAAGAAYTVKKICDCVADCKEFKVGAEVGDKRLFVEGRR